jgi:hypothetical protein
LLTVEFYRTGEPHPGGEDSSRSEALGRCSRRHAGRIRRRRFLVGAGKWTGRTQLVSSRIG